MVALLIAVAFTGTGPDLASHFQVVHGKRRLVVSRTRWNGIRNALYKLDRKSLGELTSLRNGVVVTVWTWNSVPDKHGHPRSVRSSDTQKIPRKRFLDIGEDRDFGFEGTPTVSTDAGREFIFKWLWVDLAHVVLKWDDRHTSRPSYDVRKGESTWEMYGWYSPASGGPSSRVYFASEDGRLVFRKIEITAEFGA